MVWQLQPCHSGRGIAVAAPVGTLSTERHQALKCNKKQNVAEKMLPDAGQPARLGGLNQNPLEPGVFLKLPRISKDDSNE